MSAIIDGSGNVYPVIDGPFGPRGPTGPTGLDGPQGSRGPTGEIGPAGPTGPDGPTGATGATGVTGYVGLVGPRGPQGSVGATGGVEPNIWSLAQDFVTSVVNFAYDTSEAPITSYFECGAQSSEASGNQLQYTNGSFRAGYVSGTDWQAANRGSNSVAFGVNTLAKNANSVTFGINCNSSSDNTISYGFANTSTSGQRCVVGGGMMNSANDDNAVAIGGIMNNVAGAFSTSICGEQTQATNLEGDNELRLGGYNNRVLNASSSNNFMGPCRNSDIDTSTNCHLICGENHSVGAGCNECVIASGTDNSCDASVVGARNAILCGNNNLVSGSNSVVVCGAYNTAKPTEGGAVLCGRDNDTTLSNNLAVGRNIALNSDRTIAYGRDITSSGENSLLISCNPAVAVNRTVASEIFVSTTGGIFLYTDANHMNGVKLDPNANSWSGLCDRDYKYDIEKIDISIINDDDFKLPDIYEYNFIGDDATRNIGPIAQEWYALFNDSLFGGSKPSDREINSSDIDGVALLALKRLSLEYERLTALAL